MNKSATHYILYFAKCTILLILCSSCSQASTGAERTDSQHQKNKSARAKRQLSAFTHHAAGSSDGPQPELVMTCDLNEAGFNQEDALVLNLRFADDSGTVLQSLKDQQTEIKSQISEIWELFKETHREQAKLIQLQTALRQQNAQMMALFSNAVKSNFDAKSPGFVENLFDMSSKERNLHVMKATEKSKKDVRPNNVTTPAPPKRDVFLQDQGHPEVVEFLNETNQEEIFPEEILMRSVYSGNIETTIVEQEIFPDDDVTADANVDSNDVSTSLIVQNGNILIPEIKSTELPDILCQHCDDGEFCVIEVEDYQCYPCTECSQGYQMTTPCTRDQDIICEDINECSTFGQEETCKEAGALCVNTPGGYLCVGGDASCIDNYYFNRRSSQCEQCSTCTTLQHIIVPCSKFSDVICRTEDMEQQTDVWKGGLKKPNKYLKNVEDLNAGFSLVYSDISENNQTIIEITKHRRKASRNPTNTYKKDFKNVLNLSKHGIIWMELNMAIRHSCRSYVQVTYHISNGAESVSSNGKETAVLDRSAGGKVEQDKSQKSLAATRIEHSSGDRYKFIDLGAVAEVEPGQNIWVTLHSAHQGCAAFPSKHDQYALRSIAPSQRSGPFSVLWLSHDTGAVAFRATMKTNSAFSTLYAQFSQDYASDLHVVNLDQDGRYFVFNEDGVVLAKYHQALYTIGDSCTEHGYSMVANIERRDGESGETLVKSHKAGVSYTDNAMSLTLLTAVADGDRISLDLISPARCQVRHMSDLNLGVVNLLWIPRHSSASLIARLDHRDEIQGSVKSKALKFVETQNTNPAKLNLVATSYFEFKEAGRVYINYVTRTIHSCDYLKVSVHYIGNSSPSLKPVEIVHQVLGDTAGHWDGISLGGSHTVEAGSRCYVTMTCVRGRIDDMSYGEWSTLSILWLPL
ncbi:uncharacterized protein LOC120329222 isoform X1 [Styela clava]